MPSSGNEARISFTVNGFQRHGKTSCEFWDTKESNRARIVGQIELGTKREAIEVAGEAGEQCRIQELRGFYTVQSIIDRNRDAERPQGFSVASRMTKREILRANVGLRGGTMARVQLTLTLC